MINHQILDILRDPTYSNRKITLFGLSLCSLVKHLMRYPQTLRLLQLVERGVEETIPGLFDRMNEAYEIFMHLPNVEATANFLPVAAAQVLIAKDRNFSLFSLGRILYNVSIAYCQQFEKIGLIYDAAEQLEKKQKELFQDIFEISLDFEKK